MLQVAAIAPYKRKRLRILKRREPRLLLALVDVGLLEPLVPLEFEDGTPCIDSGESEAFGDDEFTCQADDEPFDEDIPF